MLIDSDKITIMAAIFAGLLPFEEFYNHATENIKEEINKITIELLKSDYLELCKYFNKYRQFKSIDWKRTTWAWDITWGKIWNMRICKVCSSYTLDVTIWKLRELDKGRRDRLILGGPEKQLLFSLIP